jgi:hypothetical protein
VGWLWSNLWWIIALRDCHDRQEALRLAGIQS